MLEDFGFTNPANSIDRCLNKLNATQPVLSALFCSAVLCSVKVLEPVLIVVIITTASVFLPLAFECIPYECPGVEEPNSTAELMALNDNACSEHPRWPLQAQEGLQQYFCSSEAEDAWEEHLTGGR